MKGITKQEIKYIFIAVVFAVVWYVLLIPQLMKWGLQNSSPYVQFLLLNVGLFIFLQIFLKARTLGTKINFSGALGVITLFMALDILVPPLAVNFNGTLASVEGGPVFLASSTDWIMGYFATNTIGLHGFMVFAFTYILVPAILLTISASLISNFVKEL
jgi:hypothetical protein